MKGIRKKALATVFIASTVFMAAAFCGVTQSYAKDVDGVSTATEELGNNGGGYAVSNQLGKVGYAVRLYDATNGLPTSDANFVLAASDGYIWIGSYGGVIKYDGASFERMDSKTGLTSGKTLYEDTKGRIWVGTNDNGIVVIDGEKTTQITYKEGLPSSTIRALTEDSAGNIYVGTTGGVCLIDADYNVTAINDSHLQNKYITYMTADSSGRILGNTRDGDLFIINNKMVTYYYASSDIIDNMITIVYPDPNSVDDIYIGDDTGQLYHGSISKGLKNLTQTDLSEYMGKLSNITYACGKIWVISDDTIGYMDGENGFCPVDVKPLYGAIEMLTQDYQGNIWIASTRQGVAEIVTSNFQNVTDFAGIEQEVVNTTCLLDGNLYIGADKGIRIVDKDYKRVENDLTQILEDTRVRCITADKDKNLWISTYTNGLGLLCYSNTGDITYYNEKNGFISNSVRCTYNLSDGTILVGTNKGVAFIKNGEVVKTISAADGLENEVCLTVCEGINGNIYIGTDGGGIYSYDGTSLTNIGRDDGLTSDVILRIKPDSNNNVDWIITSNSIEYIKDGSIINIKTFPYNNNFDLFFNDDNEIWVLSSYGVYRVSATEMLNNDITEYAIYNSASGLTSIPTGNSFSALDEAGNLYIAGRSGVNHVNINDYYTQASEIKVAVKEITYDDTEVEPEEDGTYVIPADAGRIQMKAAILNYTLSDPTIRVYLEGDNDSGITAYQSELGALEYTGLSYGDYTLHLQIVDEASGTVYQDSKYKIEKKPHLFELTVVKLLIVSLVAVFVGLIVWRVMTNTIIRRQYKEIQLAKEEAERANSAKSRFLANMSHEIRTPINTIIGMDEMILREERDEEHKKYFMSVVNYALDIRSAAETLLGLINDILDLSKIESGKMHLVEQEYNTKEQIRGMVKMIRVRSDQKDLYFDLDIDENIPTKLYGDYGKIKQVVLNLLTNAVKYTEEGGFVLKINVLEQTMGKCKLKFSVKDTGIGVKPEDMDKLFSAFERLDEEKNTGIQGTGLGLDISRQFAELMNGSLTCDSVYGEGSEFIFIVEQEIVDAAPIGAFDEEEEAVRGPYVPLFVAPDASILVVDDNPMNLTVLRGLLKATKVFVTTAESGEECLEKLKYGEYDVVFLDHLMPGMDGLETVKKIREKYPDLPVYAFTANSMPEGDDFYTSRGFNGYLSKPVDGIAMEKIIKRHLSKDVIMDVENTPDNMNEAALPEDLGWLKEIEEISVEDGIKNNGGVDTYLSSLRLFYDTIDENVTTIENALKNNDIKLYTVKVHTLKTSARIIGALGLSKLALELEEAGKKEDIDLINAKNKELLTVYKSFGKKLERLEASKKAAGSKDASAISPEELKDAYDALKELTQAMDYDGVEVILNQLQEYSLPDDDEKNIKEIEKNLKLFDWDKIEEILQGIK